MKVLMRADAGLHQGSGHVMRCLTLAEELTVRGHEVQVVTAPSSIPWLEAGLESSGLVIHPCEPDELNIEVLLGMKPDWVVVDSYRIDSERVSELNRAVPVLAIIDGDARSMIASLYLDQNLGSDAFDWPSLVVGRLLAGSSFALVRNSILKHRRDDPWRINGIPRITAFMGGTDPTGTIVGVAAGLARVRGMIELTAIAPSEYHAAVKQELASIPDSRVIAPTRDLPAILGDSHIVISAAGTSAWDICSLGLPSVLVGVVDNQSESLHEITQRELALGLDLVHDGSDSLSQINVLVDRLLGDESLREDLSIRCLNEFDGLGKSRVVSAMERFNRN